MNAATDNPLIFDDGEKVMLEIASAA
jgi:histidine ammonia-lyase